MSNIYKQGDIIEYGQNRFTVLENRIAAGKEKANKIILINAVAILLIILVYALYIPFRVMMGTPAEEFSFGAKDFLIYLAAFFASFIVFVVAHEYVHYLSYRIWGKVPKEKLKFGLVVKSGMAYCISLEPTTVKESRTSLMMPIYVLVLPVMALAFALQNGFLVFLSAMFFSGSAGDLWYMWTMRKDGRDKYVIENMPKNGEYELGYLLLEKIN
ncbi:MAG: DUF3267 domain-containing protein [Clostridia bacterium]|nr:DUF3267 domain-containing protein [Clostridia bacterium]